MSTTPVPEVTATEVMENIKAGKKFLMVDVREKNEWDQVHVGVPALHIPMGVIAAGLKNENVPVDHPIVLYCAAGRRSLIAGEAASKAGYQNVTSMAGGITAWAQKGFPLAK